MNPAGVMINKMHLMGDVSQKNAFLHSLDNQNWFGEDSQKIIFIRKIEVQGQWWELARKIAHESHQWANHHPDHVVFVNYAQMAAEFIKLLLSGNKPWYLQSWLTQEHLSADPIAILMHKINEIPSILKRLQENKSGSDKLLSVLFFSFSLHDLQKLQHALMALSPVLNHIQRLSIDHNNLQRIKFTLPLSAQQWIKEYLGVLVNPKYSQKEIEIILSIISCLSVWRFAPQCLNDLNGFQIWHSRVNELYRENFHLALILEKGGDQSLPLSEEVRRGCEQDKTNPTLTLSFVRGGDSPSPLPRGRLAGGEDLPRFLIHQTGLLFLINLLKTNPTLTLPFERGGDKFLPLAEGEVRRGCKEFEQQNPWITLHQVFQKIAEEFSFSIESSMQNLLIEISAMTPDEFYEQLNNQNPLVQGIYEQLKQKLQRMNLWQSDWFFITARLEVDQAYIHGYLDNSAVRLDIRRAGLDINPGWVPWLGRVIYFHYGSYPELQTQGITP
jgi:hypothetical protein